MKTPVSKPLVALFGLVFSLAGTIDVSEAAGPGGPSRCATLKVSPPVNFRGRTLEEIPDIREPELRLANELLSAGCHGRADELINEFWQKNRGNHHIAYVRARSSWMSTGNTDDAEMRLIATLEEHPNFLSGKVLLAGIRFEQNRLDEMVALLNAVEPLAPTDVWVYVNRMRFEALRTPSRDLRTRLMEMARNPAFPPNVRGTAIDSAKQLPNPTDAEYLEILRASLDTGRAAFNGDNAVELALWLTDKDKPAEVRALLESPRAEQEKWLRFPMNRNLLAQAYLMEAAKINAQPSPANESLVRRADEILNGDYTFLSLWISKRPKSAHLKPFMEARVHPDEVDQHGNTPICNAVSFLDADEVRRQIELGADPNGSCSTHDSLVGYLIHKYTKVKVAERQAVMRALLEGGAKPTGLDTCRSLDRLNNCTQVLLPILEKYSR